MKISDLKGMLERAHKSPRPTFRVARKIPEDTVAGCIDCGQHLYAMTYMVEDDLWASAGLRKDQLCCEDCLSIRIGRELTIDDYTNAIINLPLLRGYIMAKKDGNQS